MDSVLHLFGIAVGWGGNPTSAAIYVSVYPKANDGKITHTLSVKDVPVDGFLSVSVCNEKGYFEKNDLDAYSLNNLTAKPNADGSFTTQPQNVGFDHYYGNLPSSDDYTASAKPGAIPDARPGAQGICGEGRGHGARRGRCR